MRARACFSPGYAPHVRLGVYAFSTGSDYVWPSKRSCKRLLTTMVRAFQITWIAKDVRATFRINSWSMAETGNHAVGTVTLSSVLCRLVVAAITARVASTSTAYRHWPCQTGGARSHTVAKASREDVLVYSLNRLMLREAAQAKGRDVHKCRPSLSDQLSHTCPNRWGDLNARTTEASRHVESVEVRSPIQHGP